MSNQSGTQEIRKEVFDACCGSKMFWFDRQDSRAVFMDKRREEHFLPDKSSRGGTRHIVISPDILGDFTSIPFPDESFSLVVFDPPHFARNGKKSWIGLKYGTLPPEWRSEIERGFSECFRVLKPTGVLVFKWNESEIPVGEILKLSCERPLFGNRCGKTAKSHWIVFMKGESPAAPNTLQSKPLTASL